MDKSQKFRICKNVIYTELDDEAIILDHERGIYFALNEVGMSVIEELSKGSRTVKRLLEVVMSEYEVEEDMAMEDLVLLLEHLLSEKLIREVIKKD